MPKTKSKPTHPARKPRPRTGNLVVEAGRLYARGPAKDVLSALAICCLTLVVLTFIASFGSPALPPHLEKLLHSARNEVERMLQIAE